MRQPHFQRAVFLLLMLGAPLLLLAAPPDSWSEEPVVDPDREAIRVNGEAAIELPEILKAFSRVMDAPILFDPDDARIVDRRVATGISLSASKAELVSTLETILDVHDLCLLDVGTKARRIWRVVHNDDPAALVSDHLMLVNEEAGQVATMLLDLYPTDSQRVRFMTSRRANSLHVRAPKRHVPAIQRLVRHLDVTIFACGGRPTGRIWAPRHVTPAALLSALRPHVTKAMFRHGVYGEKPPLRPVPVLGLDPTGTRLVCLANDFQWELIRNLAEALDQKPHVPATVEPERPADG